MGGGMKCVRERSEQKKICQETFHISKNLDFEKNNPVWGEGARKSKFLPQKEGSTSFGGMRGREKCSDSPAIATCSWNYSRTLGPPGPMLSFSGLPPSQMIFTSGVLYFDLGHPTRDLSSRAPDYLKPGVHFAKDFSLSSLEKVCTPA